MQFLGSLPIFSYSVFAGVRDGEEAQKSIPCLVASSLSMKMGSYSKYSLYCTTYDMSQNFIS